MTATLMVLLALLVLAMRALWARRRLAGWERLWRLAQGPVTVELRRRAMLALLGHDSQPFPQPREFRILSLRLAGIPLWSQQSIVSLPMAVDARIDAVGAAEFDHLFDEPFRQAPPRRAVRALFAPLH